MDVIEQEGYKALKFPEGSLMELEMDVVPTEVTAYLVRDENRLEIGENEAIFPGHGCLLKMRSMRWRWNLRKVANLRVESTYRNHS